MELAKRKHPRLRGYDYSQNQAYFITVCTADKRPTLSRVTTAQIELSQIGLVLDEQIRHLPNRYPNVTIDHYVIMPTHFHLLLSIRRNAEYESAEGASPFPTRGKDAESGLAKRTRAGVSLSQVIGACKSLTTRIANQREQRPGRVLFQSSFHDHIIRDERDYLQHWQYIDDNPAKWADDPYYCD